MTIFTLKERVRIFEMAPITWTQKQKGVDDLYKHLFRDK